MKLFEKDHQVFNRTEPYLTSKGVAIDVEEFLSNMNEYDAIDTAMEARDDLIDIKATLLENRDQVNEASVKLYNRSVTTILNNLGVDYHKHQLSVESLTESSIEIHYANISMEGIIQDLWEKIKALFRKIFEGIKKFYNNHIAKSGRVRKGLVKMKDLLESTKNDAKATTAKNVSSSMKRHFKGYSTVDGGSASDFAATALIAVNGVQVPVNKAALAFVDKELPSIEDIKALVDKVKKVREDRKDAGGSAVTFSKLKDGEDADKVESITAGGSRKKDTKHVKGFGASVLDSLKKLVDKKTPGGSKWTSIEVDNEGSLVLEKEEGEGNDPSSVAISDKKTLLENIKACIVILDAGDINTKGFEKINDAVTKRFDELERAVKAVDKGIEEEGANKREIQAEFKEHLDSIKVFMKSYNAISKDIFKIIINTCEANLDYAKECIKYYG